MRKLLWLAVFIVAFAQLGFAATVVINASEDTFVTETDGIIGSTNYSAYLNYGSHPFADVFRIKSGPADLDVRTLLKFNNAQMQTKVIDSLYLTYRGLSNCGTFASRIYFQPDDSWNEYVVTYNTMPSLDTSESNALKGTNSTGASNTRVLRLNSAPPPATQSSSELVFGFGPTFTFWQPNANLFDDLYTDANTSLETYKTDSCGALVGNGASMAQKEGNNTANISFVANLVDYQAVQVQATDVIGAIYYDFETQSGQYSSFPQADFYWNPNTNVLTPIQPASLVRTDLDNSNSLSTVNCGSLGPFSTSNIGTINVPTGSYSIICFDLKNEHGGNQFYGAIKVINNTVIPGRGIGFAEFDFWSAIYSSSLVAFSSATIDPDPAQAGRNLTLSWTTSANITSGLRFRYLSNGVWSSYVTLENTTQKSSHQIMIPSNLILPAFYEYNLFGDANGTSYASQTANFTVFESFTTDFITTTGIGLNATYFDFETATKSSQQFSGADFGLIVSGRTLHVISPKGFITVEPTSANTLENLDCRQAPAYSNGNTSGISDYSVFCFDLSSQHSGNPVYGAIKILNLTNTSINFYWSLYTESFVTFFSIVKNPVVPVSSKLVTISWQTSIPLTSQLQYSYQRVNETGYTGYYSLQDTSAHRTVHSLTIPAEFIYLGDYRFFLAGLDVNNNTYTSDVFNFTVINQTSVVPSITNPIGSIFGLTNTEALAMISMIVTLIVTIIAAILTKNGLVAGISFSTMLMIFIAMSWLPLVVGVILGIIAVMFLVYLIRAAIAGGQGN